jgi:hypothetical protein
MDWCSDDATMVVDFYFSRVLFWLLMGSLSMHVFRLVLNLIIGK